ncbi:MAG: hypothetical protein WCV00_08195 [Verrucomicrobiia bacterium]|jgi:hypothetical protein
MKVERTIQIRWRLLGGCAVLLLAALALRRCVDWCKTLEQIELKLVG